MPELTTEMFTAILPKAVIWAENVQKFILQQGEELSFKEQQDARLAGVQAPENIRVFYVFHIPRPDDGLLKSANYSVQLVTPNSAGLTLYYGIFIRLDCKGDRQLLVHEFVHTAQYERLGGIEGFLRQYLEECNRYTYPQAPMELEAVRTAQRICSQ